MAETIVIRPGGRAGLAEARAVRRFQAASARRWAATLTLVGLLVLAAILALGLGSVSLSAQTIVQILLAKLGLASNVGIAPGQETIVLQIRLPRPVSYTHLTL